MTLNHQFEALLTRVCVRLLLRGGRPLSQQIQRSVRRPCCPFAFQSFLDGRRFLRTPGQGLGTLTDGFSTLAYFRGLKKKAALNLKRIDVNLCALTQQRSGWWLSPLVWSAAPPAAVGPVVFYCELLLQQQKRGQITNSLTLTPFLSQHKGACSLDKSFL